MIEVKPEGVVLNLIVSPGRGSFYAEFDRKTETLKLKTKSPPLKGKANQELEKELKKLFKAKTWILTGLKNRKKTILVESEKKKVLSALNAL